MMNLSNSCKRLVSCLLLVCTALASSAFAAVTYQGFRFENSLQLGGAQLQLNGLGTRAVLFIKGYAAGLYVTEKSSQPEVLVANLGPKRIQINMLRQATAHDFKEALVAGIKKNASPAQWEALSSRVLALEKTIDLIGTVSPGDAVFFDYTPEAGCTVQYNGSAKGAAIKGHDFYSAVLEIFIGTIPVDKKLKQGLLGI